MVYMVTFTINIPPMLVYIPYMDPMGYIERFTNFYRCGTFFEPKPGPRFFAASHRCRSNSFSCPSTVSSLRHGWRGYDREMGQI